MSCKYIKKEPGTEDKDNQFISSYRYFNDCNTYKIDLNNNEAPSKNTNTKAFIFGQINDHNSNEFKWKHNRYNDSTNRVCLKAQHHIKQENNVDQHRNKSHGKRRYDYSGYNQSASIKRETEHYKNDDHEHAPWTEKKLKKQLKCAPFYKLEKIRFTVSVKINSRKYYGSGRSNRIARSIAAAAALRALGERY